MDHHEHLVGLLLIQISFLTSELVEFRVKEITSLFILLTELILESHFKVRVEDSQKKIHHQEEPKDQVDYKEEAIPSTNLVGWQHDVWVIGGGHEDEHIEHGVTKAAEVLHPLQGAREEPLPHPAEVKHVHQNEEHHGHRVSHDQQVSLPVVADESDGDNHVNGADEGSNPGIDVSVQHPHHHRKNVNQTDGRQDLLRLP
jgi:hypothetical protein